MTKDWLRTEMLRARRGMAQAAPEAAERLVGHWPASLQPRIVSAYRPIRSEIDPGPLLAWLGRRGATTALPVTPPRGSDAPMTYRAWSPGQPLVRGVWGIEEPGEDAPSVTPDIVLTPLLAFNLDGGRLGYGKGHFDRTLAVLRAAAPTIAIGLAYAAQARDDIPIEPHDQPLDGVLTESAYIDTPIPESFMPTFKATYHHSKLEDDDSPRENVFEAESEAAAVARADAEMTEAEVRVVVEALPKVFTLGESTLDGPDRLG